MKKCCEIRLWTYWARNLVQLTADREPTASVCASVCVHVCVRVYTYMCARIKPHTTTTFISWNRGRDAWIIYLIRCVRIKHVRVFPFFWQPQTVEMLSNSSFILLLLGMVDIILGNVDGFMRMILDHPVIILCMVYDHPELGMIGYHPGMWMVYLNLQFVWNFYWGWLWPSCSHTLCGMTILW